MHVNNKDRSQLILPLCRLCQWLGCSAAADAWSRIKLRRGPKNKGHAQPRCMRRPSFLLLQLEHSILRNRDRRIISAHDQIGVTLVPVRVLHVGWEIIFKLAAKLNARCVKLVRYADSRTSRLPDCG